MAKFSDYMKNLFFLVILLQFAPTIFNHIKKQYSKIIEPRTKVGLITIKGTISNAHKYTRYLKKYFQKDDIKAILMIIDSPGGAAGSSESIAHELSFLKKEFPKPIICLSENTCASGAYYVASATDYIIVAPSTIVGSIGTYIPYQFKLGNFLKDYNINYEAIKSGDYKLATDPFTDMTAEQRTLLNAITESSYQTFITHVAKHRPKLNVDTHQEWANGKIFTGVQALQEGLIDEIGSRSDALKKLKELAIIEGKIEWVRPAQKTSFWSSLTQQDAPDDEETIVSSLINSICATLESRYKQHAIH